MVTPAKFSTSHLSHDAGMQTAATTPTVAENGMVHHQISAPSLPSTTSDREDNSEFTSEQAPLVCYAMEQLKLRHHKPLTEEDVRRAPERRSRQVELRRDCPYLDTVNPHVLDFDFEKFCSISLSNLNVYACLVCGKYYQGRGLKSHAYTHSLEAGHHVFINLQTEKVYCLPDGYEINDPSLDDIRHVLNPRFTREQVLNLDKNKQWSRALDGSNCLPGMVGLNNIKETDFVNVTIQSLMRVTPLRNFFLIPENYQHSKSPLVHRFGELTCKIWHARNLKGQVSPHEFLQAVMKASDKRFQIGVQSDPVEFMSWLLNTLHAKLKSSKKKNRSIIHDCFQGELEVVKEIHRKHILEKKEDADEQNGEAEQVFEKRPPWGSSAFSPWEYGMESTHHVFDKFPPWGRNGFSPGNSGQQMFMVGDKNASCAISDKTSKLQFLSMHELGHWHVLRARFLDAPAWGQAGPQGGGNVITMVAAMAKTKRRAKENAAEMQAGR